MLAITKQLKSDLARFKVAKKSIKTLFIGGGTPSTVEAKLYQSFFDLIRPYLQENIEIATEANPNSATKVWLEGMKALGINRISFGTQSFHNDKLRLLNRAHSGEDTKTAVKNAYDLGIKNLSIDLIYATSMDSQELLQEDLREAFDLPINHLSAYALIIEEGTAFFKTPEVAKEVIEETQWFIDAIKDRGFRQYEISNFGTYESEHNKGYWNYEHYLGIGAGAVGCVDKRRYYPQADVQAYIDNPLAFTEEILDDEAVKSEKILLAMRSCVGFDPSLLNEDESKRLEILLNEKKLTLKKGRIYNEDYMLADELALFLLQ